MSGTNQNPYPNCAKCFKSIQEDMHDSRGWENFKKHDETGLTTEDIYICPNCITGFQAVEDLEDFHKADMTEMNYKIGKNIRLLADLGYAINWAKQHDKPQG